MTPDSNENLTLGHIETLKKEAQLHILQVLRDFRQRTGLNNYKLVHDLKVTEFNFHDQEVICISVDETVTLTVSL